MSHEERNLIEILRRLSSIERKLATPLDVRKTFPLSGEQSQPPPDGGGGGSVDEWYIRHDEAEYEWDMLAAEINDVTGQAIFARKDIDDIRSKLAEKFFPKVDSTTAIGFFKSDETTPVVIIDTLNTQVGIGIPPESALHVNGSFTVTNGDVLFDNEKPAVILSDAGLVLQSDKELILNSIAGVVLSKDTSVRSLDTYGWSIKSTGDAYFRNVIANKINARFVSTGTEQYVGGRQTMCKSASPLTDDFVVPAPGASNTLRVEPFADYPFVNVFTDGDIVRLIHVSLYNGKYNTSDCWGTVVLDDSPPPSNPHVEQMYIFTRSTSPNSGSANANAIIKAGGLVLDFGMSGNGYIVSTVV